VVTASMPLPVSFRRDRQRPFCSLSSRLAYAANLCRLFARTTRSNRARISSAVRVPQSACHLWCFSMSMRRRFCMSLPPPLLLGTRWCKLRPGCFRFLMRLIRRYSFAHHSRFLTRPPRQERRCACLSAPPYLPL
jgi:hypothetical protein